MEAWKEEDRCVLRTCQGTKGEEEFKEQEADRLLRRCPPDPERPVYTERQLMRHRCEWGTMSLEAPGVGASLPLTPMQSALDELAFLGAVSCLNRCERRCLRAWLLGWTQREMLARFGSLPPASQSGFSRALHSALCKCYDARGLTFAQFSRHTVCRKPGVQRQ